MLKLLQFSCQLQPLNQNVVVPGVYQQPLCRTESLENPSISHVCGKLPLSNVLLPLIQCDVVKLNIEDCTHEALYSCHCVWSVSRDHNDAPLMSVIPLITADGGSLTFITKTWKSFLAAVAPSSVRVALILVCKDTLLLITKPHSFHASSFPLWIGGLIRCCSSSSVAATVTLTARRSRRSNECCHHSSATTSTSL